MKKFCLALDLKDNKDLIREYEIHHQQVWPEILQSLEDAGILSMELFRVSNRLFMIMETNDNFSFEEKGKADAANPKVVAWEALMWKYQQALPGSKPGEKWVLMGKIFEYNKP